MEARPSWWPSWYPIRCPGCGSPFLPGRISLSWAGCTCPGAGAAHGHHVLYCAANGCQWHAWPPEHQAGTDTDERPRVV